MRLFEHRTDWKESLPDHVRISNNTCRTQSPPLHAMGPDLQAQVHSPTDLSTSALDTLLTTHATAHGLYVAQVVSLLSMLVCKLDNPSHID